MPCKIVELKKEGEWGGAFCFRTAGEGQDAGPHALTVLSVPLQTVSALELPAQKGPFSLKPLRVSPAFGQTHRKQYR